MSPSILLNNLIFWPLYNNIRIICMNKILITYIIFINFSFTDGDHDSGVDENTQHPVGESPTKKVGSGGATTRIPKKTPPVSPVKVAARSRATGGAAGGGRVPRSKSVPKPFTSWATPPSTSESAKKGAYSFLISSE